MNKPKNPFEQPGAFGKFTKLMKRLFAVSHSDIPSLTGEERQERKRSLQAATVALAFMMVLALAVVATQAGQAQTITVLHNFTGGGDGAGLYAGLTIDKAGNLYGTTLEGGSNNFGTVFKLSYKGSGWIFTPLYSFQGGNDGANPRARVIIGPNGSLYGTTTAGGGSGCGGSGCGTVFSLRPSAAACHTALCPWTENVLYRFTGGSDGAVPSNGDVVFDQVGNLYGTTFQGGVGNCDGTTCGVVYKLTPSNGGWTESVLYAFAGGSDGGNPYAGVTFDKSGNLYGTASSGGNLACNAPYGCGTVFQLTPSGSGWSENTIYTFQGGSDGANPRGGLMFDPSANLYGTTPDGGSEGGGTVFMLTPSNGSWTFGVVYSFTGSVDSSGPFDSLISDAAGNVYGTTYEDGVYGYGSLFKLIPSGGGWKYTSIREFTGGSDGGNPAGSVVLDASGNLYGTTFSGGADGRGVVFEITPSAWGQGFDFRSTPGFVTDPPGSTYDGPLTYYATTGSLTTYGWNIYAAPAGARDRSTTVDPRLAGINYVYNGSPALLYVDLPSPGTYSIALAMGDDGYAQCFTQCQVQFLDGSTVLATVTGGQTAAGYFYDAKGNNWSAAAWPTDNVSQQVTLVGTELTVVVGTNQDTGDLTPIAYLGVTLVSAGPTFALEAPSSVSVGQGQYSAVDVSTVLIAGFNSPINLSATGAPAGTTLTFNPGTIPAPGAGTSIMTVTVPSGTPIGNYPVTVTGTGGGVIQTATLTLTVTASAGPAFAVTAEPTTMNVSSHGGQVTGAVATAITDGFNSAVSFSAAGAPQGTIVSFNPSSIPAPGAGSSTMTVNVPAGAAFGSYAITVTATAGLNQQTAVVTLTVSSSGNVNLPAGFGWAPLGTGTDFCFFSPGWAYYNPQAGAVDAFDFLGGCGAAMVAYSGGAADTTNDRYFLWTSGHTNYQGSEMYELDLLGPSPSVSRITDPAWTVDNTDVPPDCACKGTNNCGQGMWHDGAGNPVSSPFFESGSNGPTFESIPAPDGSDNQPSCGYGSKFQPNAREIYAGIVYNSSLNKLFAWGGALAADPSENAYSNWSLDLNQNPPRWTRLTDSAYQWYTAAVHDYTTNHPTSGYDLVFDENQTLYAYNPSTDTYTVLSSSLQFIGYNANVELDPLHHYLVMEEGDNNHLRIVDIDSCTGSQCSVTSLDETASCQDAMGYWVGLAWDSKRNVMAIYPSSTNCNGAGCTPPFNTVYLLNPDPNNPVTITYQGKPQTIQPQQCFAATYGQTNPPQSFGPGVYSRFKYYPNEDIYLYIPFPTNPWILRLEQ